MTVTHEPRTIRFTRKPEADNLAPLSPSHRFTYCMVPICRDMHVLVFTTEMPSTVLIFVVSTYVRYESTDTLLVTWYCYFIFWRCNLMFLEVLPHVSGGVTSSFWRCYLKILEVLPHVSGCDTGTSCFWMRYLMFLEGGVTSCFWRCCMKETAPEELYPLSPYRE